MKSKIFRTHSTVIVVALVGILFAAQAPARDIEEIPPHSVRELIENLHIAATERAAPFFQETIRPYLKNADPSGLIIIGVAVDHEVESARLFARLVREKMGMRLVLLSSWGLTQVPGYDGVIINEEGLPVANFSMKRVNATRVGRVEQTARQAFAKIRRFSTIEGWMSMLTHQIPQHRDRLAITKAKQEQFLYRVYHEFADLMSLLSIGEGRPDWVLMDAGDRPNFVYKDAVDFSAALPESITQDPKKVVIVRSADQFFTFNGGQMSDYNLKGCESELNYRH